MENQNNLQLLTTKNFNGVQLDCYQAEDNSNDFWATREQIGRLLEYENPRKAISIIHHRNKERLDNFSMGVQIETPLRGVQTAIVYNFRGLLEICRWSNQPKANAVMDFLWDVADDIRKYGMYMSDKVLNEMITGSEQFKTLMDMYAAEKGKTKALTEKIEADRAYKNLGKVVLSLPGSISVSDTADLLLQHGYDIGRNRIYKMGR